MNHGSSHDAKIPRRQSWPASTPTRTAARTSSSPTPRTPTWPCPSAPPAGRRKPIRGEVRYRSLAEFRDIIEQIVEQKLVDIMLMSASTSEVLTIHKRIFDNSPVTPAARANDTTDIHIIRGSKYPTQPSLPFRTATLDHIQCGHLDCKPEERHLGANLGLYSITFNNDTVLDREALEEYKQFRLEAERKGFRHFLEVFDPNRPEAVEAEQAARRSSTTPSCARSAASPRKGRPLFLKMVYHGPKAMEELVHYDPHLVVGILGGSAGTTYDAFKLLSEAKKYGARVALFGRKINNAENQLAFIRFLRLIADGEISAEEAVRAYHGVLQTARRQAAALAGRRHEVADQRDELRRQRQGGQRPARRRQRRRRRRRPSGCGCKASATEDGEGRDERRRSISRR